MKQIWKIIEVSESVVDEYDTVQTTVIGIMPKNGSYPDEMEVLSFPLAELNLWKSKLGFEFEIDGELLASLVCGELSPSEVKELRTKMLIDTLREKVEFT